MYEEKTLNSKKCFTAKAGGIRKNGPAFNATNKFSTNTLLINILNLNKLLTTNIIRIVYTARYQGNKAGYNISLFYKKKKKYVNRYFYTNYDVSLSTIVTFNYWCVMKPCLRLRIANDEISSLTGEEANFWNDLLEKCKSIFAFLSIYVSLINRLKSSPLFKVQS